MGNDFQIYDSLVDVVFFLSVEPENTFKFVQVNKSFLTTTGLKKEQVVGKYVHEVIPQPSLSLVLSNYRLAIKEKRTIKWHEVTDYPSGTKYGEVTVVPVIDDNGKCTSLVGNVHDVTDLVNAKKKSEEALLAKSRFLDIAAHELRNPVASLYLMLQVIDRQIQHGNPIDHEKIVELLHPATRLNRLVADLLNLSRLEKDVVKLDMGLHDLHQCIVGWIKELELIYPQRKLHFQAKAKEVLFAFDALRIYQVFTNLVENAVKYSPATSPIEINLEDLNGEVRVSISDKGEGISEKMLENIFDPFSRGGVDIRVRHTGLGLGLPISEKIIKLHHGTIQVESKEGEGSTFSFTIPKKALP